MKRIFLVFSVVSVFSLLNSCSDDEKVETNARKYGGTVTAMVGGDVYTLSDNSIYIVDGRFEMFNHLDKKDGAVFGFATLLGIEEAEYELCSGHDIWGEIITTGAVMAMSYRENGNDPYYLSTAESNGSFVISEIDETKKTMSGTFSGDLYHGVDGVTISSGVFTDVPYVIREGIKGKHRIATLDGEDVELTPTGRGYGAASTHWGDIFENTTQQLHLKLPSDLTPGTYTMTELKEEDSYIKFVDGVYTYLATAGTLVVTIHNSTTGEFEATFNLDFDSLPLGEKSLSLVDGVISFNYKTTEMN